MKLDMAPFFGEMQSDPGSSVKAAQRRGVKFGRKVKLTPDQIDHARKLIDKGVADLLNVGRSTLYRALAG
jgi:DNA invertase Pin-like site-specific DNA recombinase